MVALGLEFSQEDRARLDRIADALEQNTRVLSTLNKTENTLMAQIDDLKAAVAADTTVEQSAITLLTSLGAQVAAVAGDQAATEALAQTITSNAAALSAAVTANTPAAPAPDQPAA